MNYRSKPYKRNIAQVECKNRDDTSNNRSNWDHLKIIQKISEQHTWKAWDHITTENSYIGHRTHTSESANVKVQNIMKVVKRRSFIWDGSS